MGISTSIAALDFAFRTSENSSVAGLSQDIRYCTYEYVEYYVRRIPVRAYVTLRTVLVLVLVRLV